MTEPRDALDELLNDPLIQLVMKRDGVRPQEVRLLLERARDRSARPELPPAHVIASTCCGAGMCT